MIALATHRRWRTATLFALYAAQGAPEGLLYVAIPAWLASQGAPASEIGSYIAIILLPWGFKLLNGLLMDRFTIRSMGRRRPWVLGAQLCLLLALVALALLADERPDLAVLSAIGFVINLAAAFQDVGIDGMAIDVVPPGERGEANGVMWGGKTIGLAASSALSAFLIHWSGVAAAALAIAAFVAAVMLFPLLLRERVGERLLPWTPAPQTPAPRMQGTEGASVQPHFIDILRKLVGAFLRWSAALFAAGIFTAFIAYGLKTAFLPSLAVERLGWTQVEFGQLAGAANVAGGAFAIFVSGPLVDRLGAHRAILAALAAMALLHGIMGTAEAHWTTAPVFMAYEVLHALVFVLLSVAVYARAMALSSPSIGATHFASFMALLNLGTSFGAQQLGWLMDRWDYAGAVFAAAFSCLAALALFRAASRL